MAHIAKKRMRKEEIILGGSYRTLGSLFSMQAIDDRTRMVLFKMLNRGVFNDINGCISTGKEVIRKLAFCCMFFPLFISGTFTNDWLTSKFLILYMIT